MYTHLCKCMLIGIVFTCSTLLLFPYPVPAGIHRNVQHVSLCYVPVDVLPRVLKWFSQAKHLECFNISPPQEVQCVHMCLLIKYIHANEKWEIIVHVTPTCSV